jgi:hypothetical protein
VLITVDGVVERDERVRLKHDVCALAQSWHNAGAKQATTMPSQSGSARVIIDGEVLRSVDESLPAGMSRTAWVNYLALEGLAAIKRRRDS